FNGLGTDRGRTRIFEYDAGMVVWNPIGSIEGQFTGDRSGWSVSLNSVGNIVAIGGMPWVGNGGLTRIFHYNNNVWNLINTVDEIGGSVSLNDAGNIVAVGNPELNSIDGGRTLIKRSNCWQYGLTNCIKKSTEIFGGNFDRSLSLNSAGNIVAIGEHSIDGGNPDKRGKTLIFEYDALLNTWNEIGSIIGENSGDQSGRSVSLNSVGNIVAIGEPLFDGGGLNSNTGRTRIFEYVGMKVWNQIGDIRDNPLSQSGNSVSLNSAGNIVAIGAPLFNGGTNRGRTRIFEYTGMNTWTQIGPSIIGENDGDQNGNSVSLNSAGNIVAIGEPLFNGGGADRGRTRIFEYDAGMNVWKPIGSIVGENNLDYSGWSVSLNSAGNIVAIGEIGFNGGGTDRGKTRILKYDALSNTWNQIGSSIEGETDLDYSGRSVSLNSAGNIVAISKLDRESHIFEYDSINDTWNLIYTVDEIGISVSLNDAGNIVASGNSFLSPIEKTIILEMKNGWKTVSGGLSYLESVCITGISGKLNRVEMGINYNLGVNERVSLEISIDGGQTYENIDNPNVFSCNWYNVGGAFENKISDCTKAIHYLGYIGELVNSDIKFRLKMVSGDQLSNIGFQINEFSLYLENPPHDDCLRLYKSKNNIISANYLCSDDDQTFTITLKEVGNPIINPILDISNNNLYISAQVDADGTVEFNPSDNLTHIVNNNSFITSFNTDTESFQNVSSNIFTLNATFTQGGNPSPLNSVGDVMIVGTNSYQYSLQTQTWSVFGNDLINMNGALNAKGDIYVGYVGNNIYVYKYENMWNSIGSVSETNIKSIDINPQGNLFAVGLSGKTVIYKILPSSLSRFQEIQHNNNDIFVSFGYENLLISDLSKIIRYYWDVSIPIEDLQNLDLLDNIVNVRSRSISTDLFTIKVVFYDEISFSIKIYDYDDLYIEEMYIGKRFTNYSSYSTKVKINNKGDRIVVLNPQTSSIDVYDINSSGVWSLIGSQEIDGVNNFDDVNLNINGVGDIISVGFPNDNVTKVIKFPKFISEKITSENNVFVYDDYKITQYSPTLTIQDTYNVRGVTDVDITSDCYDKVFLVGNVAKYEYVSVHNVKYLSDSYQLLITNLTKKIVVRGEDDYYIYNNTRRSKPLIKTIQNRVFVMFNTFGNQTITFYNESKIELVKNVVDGIAIAIFDINLNLESVGFIEGIDTTHLEVDYEGSVYSRVSNPINIYGFNLDTELGQPILTKSEDGIFIAKMVDDSSIKSIGLLQTLPDGNGLVEAVFNGTVKPGIP
ncbi:MAG: hypothetical protein GW795_00295, partial [Cyanobacteria bacterium]|nr:hypothetical protein [Cyanobacteria bacterium CG_2015-04_32_10]